MHLCVGVYMCEYSVFVCIHFTTKSRQGLVLCVQVYHVRVYFVTCVSAAFANANACVESATFCLTSAAAAAAIAAAVALAAADIAAASAVVFAAN